MSPGGRESSTCCGGWCAGEPDFGLLWMQVVVMVITALIFVIATKGRLGYAAKAKSESELNTIQVANP